MMAHGSRPSRRQFRLDVERVLDGVLGLEVGRGWFMLRGEPSREEGVGIDDHSGRIVHCDDLARRLDAPYCAVQRIGGAPAGRRKWITRDRSGSSETIRWWRGGSRNHYKPSWPSLSTAIGSCPASGFVSGSCSRDSSTASNASTCSTAL